jgi:hypothetical protein
VPASSEGIVGEGEEEGAGKLEDVGWAGWGQGEWGWVVGGRGEVEKYEVRGNCGMGAGM